MFPLHAQGSELGGGIHLVPPKLSPRGQIGGGQGDPPPSHPCSASCPDGPARTFWTGHCGACSPVGERQPEPAGGEEGGEGEEPERLK